MPVVKISDIVVKDRQRKEYGEVAELAESLADPRFGQLQPILLDQNNNLIAGGRRLAACALLAQAGRSIYGLPSGEINAAYKEAGSALHSKEMELEENVRRLELPWYERDAAVAELHRLKVSQDPNWTADKTAEMVGLSRRTVFNSLKITDAIKEHPELKQAETSTGANQRLDRILDIQRRKDAVRVAELAAKFNMQPSLNVQIKHGDAIEGMRGLTAESVDAVVCNPPFGVDIEDLFTVEKHIYDDSQEYADMLAMNIIEEAMRVLKPDRWFVFFWPTARIEYARELLLGTGFKVQRVPCVWIKPNKFVSKISHPECEYGIGYESFFFARKGNAMWNEVPTNNNVYVYDTVDKTRLHPLQMPVPLWHQILRQIMHSGETVIEPCCGSGSCAHAALQYGVHYTGWELDEEHYGNAAMWLREDQLGIRPLSGESTQAQADTAKKLLFAFGDPTNE